MGYRVASVAFLGLTSLTKFLFNVKLSKTLHLSILPNPLNRKMLKYVGAAVGVLLVSFLKPFVILRNNIGQYSVSGNFDFTIKIEVSFKKHKENEKTTRRHSQINHKDRKLYAKDLGRYDKLFRKIALYLIDSAKKSLVNTIMLLIKNFRCVHWIVKRYSNF
jgi:hypothetical protein